jgi:hypothetical protein
MRVKKIEELLMKDSKNADDVKFFVDFMESICKDFKLQFYGYTVEMYLKVYSPSKFLAFCLL